MIRFNHIFPYVPENTLLTFALWTCIALLAVLVSAYYQNVIKDGEGPWGESGAKVKVSRLHMMVLVAICLVPVLNLLLVIMLFLMHALSALKKLGLFIKKSVGDFKNYLDESGFNQWVKKPAFNKGFEDGKEEKP